MSNCFIIMPVTTPNLIAQRHGDEGHFQHVLDCLFFPAVEKAGFTPIPPSADGADIIQGQIIKHLEEDEHVLCDMTSLNANVFFELGIRTAVNKPVAMVKDSNCIDIPFDTSIIHHHTYDADLSAWSLADQIKKLAEHIQLSFETCAGANKLWKYFGLHSQAHFDSSATSPESQLELLTMEIASLKKALSNAGTTAAPKP
jgi:hypothetical protein